MLVYNVDETGLSVVHNPSKVVAQVGHSHNVYSLTSGEKGKTHTVLSCVSASGQAMLICPRKKFVPEHFKKGAVPNTLFSNSGNGWINTDLYLKWFKFFVANIPPARPVLLIQDGYESHVSIELVELERGRPDKQKKNRKRKDKRRRKKRSRREKRKKRS